MLGSTEDLRYARAQTHTRIEGHTFSCTLKIWWRGFPYEWRRKELVRGRRGGQGDFLLLRREEEVKGRGCSTTVTALSDNNFLSLSLSLVLLMARVLLRKSSIILVAWHSSCCIFQFFLKRGTPLAELSLSHHSIILQKTKQYWVTVFLSEPVMYVTRKKNYVIEWGKIQVN